MLLPVVFGEQQLLPHNACAACTQLLLQKYGLGVRLQGRRKIERSEVHSIPDSACVFVRVLSRPPVLMISHPYAGDTDVVWLINVAARTPHATLLPALHIAPVEEVAMAGPCPGCGLVEWFLLLVPVVVFACRGCTLIQQLFTTTTLRAAPPAFHPTCALARCLFCCTYLYCSLLTLCGCVYACVAICVCVKLLLARGDASVYFGGSLRGWAACQRTQLLALCWQPVQAALPLLGLTTWVVVQQGKLGCVWGSLAVGTTCIPYIRLCARNCRSSSSNSSNSVVFALYSLPGGGHHLEWAVLALQHPVFCTLHCSHCTGTYMISHGGVGVSCHV